MQTIAIIDDREDARQTAAKGIKVEMSSGWDVLESEPLPKMSDYPSWIARESVAALIVDERLGEKALSNGEHATYTGHELAEYLRVLMPVFPIYAVSAYPQDDALNRAEKVFESIFERTQLTQSPHVERILRMAGHYAEGRDKQLAELSDLASKAASGEATADDKDRLRALQQSFVNAYADTGGVLALQVLDDFERELDAFESLRKELAARQSRSGQEKPRSKKSKK